MIKLEKSTSVGFPRSGKCSRLSEQGKEGKNVFKLIKNDKCNKPQAQPVYTEAQLVHIIQRSSNLLDAGPNSRF